MALVLVSKEEEADGEVKKVVGAAEVLKTERCMASLVEGMSMVGVELVGVKVARLGAIQHIADEEARMTWLKGEEAAFVA